jgi:alpha-L-fucosidase
VNNQWPSDLSHAKDLYAYMRRLNPNVLVNDRCGRGASSADGDYATPENQLKGSLQSRYFEVVMTDTDDDNWGWVKGATNYRSAAVLIRNLVDSTSKGGNFVLNVGPTASGEFPAGHVALIDTIGAWIDVNGEAIYGTVPVPECKIEKQDGSVCYATKKGRNIYLQIVTWPTNGAAQTITIDRGDYVKSQLLDSKLKGLKLTSNSTNNITTLTLERPEKIDPYATVIKLTFKKDAVSRQTINK